MENSFRKLTQVLQGTWVIYRKHIRELLAISFVLSLFQHLLLVIVAQGLLKSVGYGAYSISANSILVLVALFHIFFVCELAKRRISGRTGRFSESLVGPIKAYPMGVIALLAMVIPTVVGLVLFVLPGVAVGIALSFTLFSFYLDEVNILGAMKQSYTFVKHNVQECVSLVAMLFVLAIFNESFADMIYRLGIPLVPLVTGFSRFLFTGFGYMAMAVFYLFGMYAKE